MSSEPRAGVDVWLVAGAQELYGASAIAAVEAHAREISAALDLPVPVRNRGVAVSAESVRRLCLEANADDACAGIIVWMHTFSPAKAWIAGLASLRKPLLHLHTQFNRELPWAEIDMDFMNLNQSAHGDRELGFMATRMGLRRKTVVGHWRDAGVVRRIATWTRACAGWHELQRLHVARFGDNMRGVAVTEGDKVEAQLRLGVAVDGYGVADLSQAVAAVAPRDVDALIAEYETQYDIASALRARPHALRDAARIELGLRAFLVDRGHSAFTDTFEDLGDLPQLPGIAVQRLMDDGYGFGAEGDWKTAALLRAVKVMTAGTAGGATFMEDYTYDFATDDGLVLGAHMLEVCPSIASGRPSCEIHPLAIGGKDDPVRLVFTARSGPAVVASLIDLGDRFRLLVNEVDLVEPEHPLPKLPVARALWRPRPNLATAAEAWLTAGGAHHTVLTDALDVEAFVDLAEIAGIELLVIDRETRLRDFARELHWNRASYRLAAGL